VIPTPHFLDDLGLEKILVLYWGKYGMWYKTNIAAILEIVNFDSHYYYALPKQFIFACHKQTCI
jgi:hypothetical protein